MISCVLELWANEQCRPCLSIIVMSLRNAIRAMEMLVSANEDFGNKNSFCSKKGIQRPFQNSQLSSVKKRLFKDSTRNG
jgi:hypothetical protein